MKYGSDKHRNGYTSLYTVLFDPLRDTEMNVAEIGIGTMIPNVCSSMVGYGLGNYLPGGSLRAWRDFFEKSNIYGFDIQPDTQFEEDRIKTFLCDSSNAIQVRETVESILPDSKKFDIIIDDGNHIDHAQYQTLRNFWPYLKNGGIYIIEDIYPGSEISSNPSRLQEIVGNSSFFFSGIKNNLCILYKKQLTLPVHSF